LCLGNWVLANFPKRTGEGQFSEHRVGKTFDCMEDERWPPIAFTFLFLVKYTFTPSSIAAAHRELFFLSSVNSIV
jgi:hypothetical protein